MKTHTPAPWHVQPIESDFCIVYSDGEIRSHVARLNWTTLAEEHGDIEANARLIVSAPDLLLALERLTHPMADDEDLSFARDCIANARGK